MTDSLPNLPTVAGPGIELFTAANGRPTYGVSYEVVDHPVDTGHRKLPGDVVDRIAAMMRADLAGAVATLSELVDRYPDVPVAKNWLMNALDAAGRRADAIALGFRMAAEHPDYLFGRTFRATRLLETGRWKDVPAVLGGMDLKLIYPQRTQFHVTEVIASAGVLCEYWLQAGDLRSAVHFLTLMQDLAPDHPLTHQTESRAAPMILAALVETAAAGDRPSRPTFRQGSHPPKKDRNRKRRRR